MRYNKIKKNDVANGHGINVSVYFQGCPHHCYNCFNGETWDFEGGKEYTEDVKQEIIDSLNINGVDRDLSILGGEPLCPENVDGVIDLCKTVKELYPEKKIWLWTGYLIENFNKKQFEVLQYLTTIIDGPFIDSKKNLKLTLRGSENQRVLSSEDSIKIYNNSHKVDD